MFKKIKKIVPTFTGKYYLKTTLRLFKYEQKAFNMYKICNSYIRISIVCKRKKKKKGIPPSQALPFKLIIIYKALKLS